MTDEQIAKSFPWTVYVKINGKGDWKPEESFNNLKDAQTYRDDAFNDPENKINKDRFYIGRTK